MFDEILYNRKGIRNPNLEAITLFVFMIFTLITFKTETLKLIQLIGAIFLILAVYFIFKK